jgi:SAM-dependent methyltransferase
MTSRLALSLLDRFYGDQPHPYQVFERQVRACLERRPGTLLDIGCGREAPVLRRFKGQARELVGLDLVDYRVQDPHLTLLAGTSSSIPMADESVDVVMARSVMEHVEDPQAAFREIHRVLKPGGAFVFLTANIWDYATIIAMMVPNRFHPWIVAKSEGREEEDVFPTVYKCNSRRAIMRLANQNGLSLNDFRYLSQYPNYLLFNGFLFLLGTGYEKVVSNVRPLEFLKGWILATVTKA